MQQSRAALLDLEELQDIYDDGALRVLLVQVRQHLTTDAASMHTEAASGAFADCTTTIHRLKSMLMFLSGERLRADFEDVEAALLNAPSAIATTLLRLQQQLDRFDAELAEALARLP
ncbi:hypothetical protein [Duganella violaceipulchra]|uniref:HPt domain-containing protein n=1 Tax=Duganella violaceipulchra TaxID=2849652 RepID=A0AA41HAD8_9BURK|nr:hypothetical protein [Duganella violaceicalia]MBV6322445.1 hypothetical protein [Duganella violaceicalia]MCP2010650.1 hypothetical protein [Duganella violaceicalia]